jgi:hypothetical protein
LRAALRHLCLRINLNKKSEQDAREPHATMRAFRGVLDCAPSCLLSSSSIFKLAPMSPETKPRTLYENLDTTFVNLWALLRNLSQRGFIGRVHVDLTDYTADVFINGSSTPLVHEVDRAAGTDTLEEGALHRLVLRVRETPGTISVFEGEDEAIPMRRGVNPEIEASKPGAPEQNDPVESDPGRVIVEGPKNETQDDRNAGDKNIIGAETNAASDSDVPPVMPQFAARSGVSDKADTIASPSPPRARSVAPDTEPIDPIEWDAIVKAGAELIGGVERGVTSAEIDFAALFNAARLALADDYTFLDPTSDGFSYANSSVTLRDQLTVNNYVAGVSEVLRRVVDRAAGGVRGRRLRERVALELFSVARKREDILARSGFGSQLDRIAGTKVM